MSTKNFVPKHPLAVLRKMLGMGQQRLAKLVGRSGITIQRVELGTLPLSERLAERIAYETWVSAQWLMDGDPKAEPWLRNHRKTPYRKEHYERLRVCFLKKETPKAGKIIFGELPPSPPGKALAHPYVSVFPTTLNDWLPRLPEIFGRILSAIYAGEQDGRGELAFSKLAMFADAMKEDYGQHGDPTVPGEDNAYHTHRFCARVLKALSEGDALKAAVYTPEHEDHAPDAEPVAPALIPDAPLENPPAERTQAEQLLETYSIARGLTRDLLKNPPRAPRW